MIHAYNFHQQLPLIEFGNKYGIVSEGYSPLIPITRLPGGPLDKPLNEISARLNAKPEQVLLAWAQSKNVVVVTSSTKKERMEGYIAAGDLRECHTSSVRVLYKGNDVDSHAIVNSSHCRRHRCYRCGGKAGRATADGAHLHPSCSPGLCNRLPRTWVGRCDGYRHFVITYGVGTVSMLSTRCGFAESSVGSIARTVFAQPFWSV